MKKTASIARKLTIAGQHIWTIEIGYKVSGLFGQRHPRTASATIVTRTNDIVVASAKAKRYATEKRKTSNWAGAEVLKIKYRGVIAA